jgi:hypothetical protein
MVSRRSKTAMLGILVLAAALLVVTLAQGERVQRGNLILTLDGGFAPLTLPRDHPAPVSVQLEAGLKTADGSVLPRVTRVELGIPGQGVITSRGLATCPTRRLRDATTERALAVCPRALIGRGRMIAQVKIPNQPPFAVHARLLAFNGRVHGQRAVIVHGVSLQPPTSVVLPFLIHLRPGKFGTVLVAHLPRTLGPWPRFARFEMDFGRRYTYRGQDLSYISASCPIPRILDASLFSFARAVFTLADGRRVSKGIARSCRAR